MNKNKQDLIDFLEQVLAELKKDDVCTTDFNYELNKGVARKGNGFYGTHKIGWDGSTSIKLEIHTENPKVLNDFVNKD